MSHTITTTGTTSGPIVTTHQSGESVRDWVERHNEAVGAQVPTGNLLVTEWTCEEGVQRVRTHRNPGESDPAFVERHEVEYVTDMLGCPPIAA